MYILSLLIIGLLIFFVVFAARPHSFNHMPHPSKEKSAMELLREKYVNGEINEETYLNKKKVIG